MMIYNEDGIRVLQHDHLQLFHVQQWMEGDCPRSYGRGYDYHNVLETTRIEEVNTKVNDLREERRRMAGSGGTNHGIVVKMKIGDIVSLKSGGPDMVISSIEPAYGRANCSWVHDGQYHSAVIPISALRADSEPKRGERPA